MRARTLCTLLAVVAALLAGRRVDAQQPAQLTIAIYAPGVPFSDSAARLAYVQGLAKAIQVKTGIPTTGKAFVRLGDMAAAKPDFAILDGQCIAAGRGGSVLAVASIGGETQQAYGLYVRPGTALPSLNGKKLAYVKLDCRDTDFLDNAMFESEVKVAKFFSGLVDKPDIAGAVAAVLSYKTADAVFAPAGPAKGLTKLFDSGIVPNAGFVTMNKAITGALEEQVREAVLAYSGSGAIDGWRVAGPGFSTLAGRMSPRLRKGAFAQPEPLRLEDLDVIVAPKSEYERTSIRHHFWQPPATLQP
jgi:hypothetical protein